MRHFLLAILSIGINHAIRIVAMLENPVYLILEDLIELDLDPWREAVNSLAGIGEDPIRVQGTLAELAIEALVMTVSEFGQSHRPDGPPIQAARILTG